MNSSLVVVADFTALNYTQNCRDLEGLVRVGEATALSNVDVGLPEIKLISISPQWQVSLYFAGPRYPLMDFLRQPQKSSELYARKCYLTLGRNLLQAYVSCHISPFNLRMDMVFTSAFETVKEGLFNVWWVPRDIERDFTRVPPKDGRYYLILNYRGEYTLTLK